MDPDYVQALSPRGETAARSPAASVRSSNRSQLAWVRSCSLPYKSPIALKDKTQALQRQKFIHVFDSLGLRRDQLGEAAGCNHVGLFATLADYTLNQSVDQRDVTIDQSGLDRTNRRTSHYIAWPYQLDAVESRRMLNQRIHRDLETRRYRAADVFAAPGHVIERRRSAEINHDTSCRVTVVGGDRIDDTVGADLLGVLVQDRHPGLDPGPHHQGLAMEVAMRQVLERLIQRWYDAGNRPRKGQSRYGCCRRRSLPAWIGLWPRSRATVQRASHALRYN